MDSPFRGNQLKLIQLENQERIKIVDRTTVLMEETESASFIGSRRWVSTNVYFGEKKIQGLVVLVFVMADIIVHIRQTGSGNCFKSLLKAYLFESQF